MNGFGPFITAWSRSSTADGDRAFFPATAGRVSAGIGSVLMGILMDLSTDSLKAELAFQESDDNVTWPVASAFTIIGTTTRSSNGTSYDTSWNTMTFTKRYVRFGFAVKNSAGSAREFAKLALRLLTRAP